MRRRLGVSIALGVAGLACACTSILGDFTSGSAPGGADASNDGMSAGDDGNGTHDGSGSDGTSTDAPEAGPPQLSCTTWKWPQPLVLEDLQTATVARFGQSITAFPLGGGPVRIIVAKSGAKLFSVYTVDPTTQTVQQVDEPGPGADFVEGIWRNRGSAANLTGVVAHVSTGSMYGTYEVFPLLDTMNATGPIPSSFGLFEPTMTQGVSQLTITPFTTTDIFEAVSVSSGSPTDYALGVGRVSPTSDPTTLGPVATAVNATAFADPRLYRANGNVYIYDINDPSTPGSTGWTVPESAIIPDGGVTPQVVSTGVLSGVVDIAPNTAAPSANVLTFENIRTGTISTGYNYRLGTVPNTNVGTFAATDLPYAAKYTSLGDTPTGSGEQVFWGDDILLLGQGFCEALSDGGCEVFPGLNLLWLNASTGARSEESGPNELLLDGVGYFDVFTVPVTITATSAVWDVVWGQHYATDAGIPYDVLYMNELECQ